MIPLHDHKFYISPVSTYQLARQAMGVCASAADASHSRRCTRADIPVVGRGDGRAGAKKQNPKTPNNSRVH